MSVPAKDVHVSTTVNHSYVAVTGGWLGTSDKSKFGLTWTLSGTKALILPLPHLDEVGVEAGIGVLDNESVLHGN